MRIASISEYAFGQVLALTVFERLWDVLKREELASNFKQMRLHFLRGGVEELPSSVDPIDSTISQALVQTRLDPDGVLGEEQGMSIEPEGDRSIAELSHPDLRIKSASEADLYDSLAERPKIGDHVDVSGADVRSSIVNVLDCALDPLELGLMARNGLVVALSP